MDKLAYHFNKKKIPAKTEGKYKYYYPCLLKEETNEQYGDNYYIITEVSEREWETLLELDRLEYNNTHKFSHHSSMPDKNKTQLPTKLFHIIGKTLWKKANLQIISTWK